MGQEAERLALRHRRHRRQGERLEAREKIGYTAKVPKWAKAYKFDPEKGITKLGDVVFHIGKFGELTPVATFDPPVELAGTTVTHASMHNASWVAEKDVRIGDTVVVEKKGEIIPRGRGRHQGRPQGHGESDYVADQLPRVRAVGDQGRIGEQFQLHLQQLGGVFRRHVEAAREGYGRKDTNGD